MKDIQVIDGADNCCYSVYSVYDDESPIVFPDFGQDVEFIDDAIAQVGDAKLGEIMRPIWAASYLQAQRVPYPRHLVL